MDSEKIKGYFSGKFSKDTLRFKIVPILLLSYLVPLFISWLFFPTDLHYNFMENSISYLGSRVVSPIGSIFFTIGTCLLGIELIPIFLYIHRRLSKICNTTTFIGSFFAILGGFFLFLVGIVSDDGSYTIFGVNQGRLHAIIAAIGILGIFFGVMLYLCSILKDSFSVVGKKQFNLKLVAISYGLVLFAVFGMGIAELIKLIYNIGFHAPGLLSFSFWEWLLMICFLFFFVMISYYLPEDL